ncbi:MAG: FAD-dependent oxidoreductase [Firmicutes bacterium]|nr:FAD-dependent oxidoreductase [Bacillota bacterium]
MKRQILILGAGPAGLSLAYNLLRRFQDAFEITVLEREDAVGGIAAGFTAHGLHFDYGSHRLHPATGPEIFKDIREMLGNALLTRPRNGRIRLLGKFIKFPLNPVDASLHLPFRFFRGVLTDMLLKPFRKKEAPLTFSAVLLNGLGKTICNHFYFPYAQKLWGLEPDRLAAEQANKRVSSNSVLKILAKAFSLVTGQKKGAVFYYPKNGFGEIAAAYAREITARGGKILLGRKVTKIIGVNGSRYQVETEPPAAAQANVAGKTRFDADFIFATIPLTDLVSMMEPAVPAEVRTAAANLGYRGMLFHYLILKTDRFTPYDAHYFPEPEFIFSRLSETKNYYDGREPEGITGLCLEIPCAVNDELWNLAEADLHRRILADLDKCGLGITVPVIDFFTKRKATVYPVYDLNYAANFHTVDRYFETLPNFVILGRQGLFVHDNVHHTLEMGYKAGQCLNAALEWDRTKWSEFRREFENNVVID